MRCVVGLRRAARVRVRGGRALLAIVGSVCVVACAPYVARLRWALPPCPRLTAPVPIPLPFARSRAQAEQHGLRLGSAPNALRHVCARGSWLLRPPGQDLTQAHRPREPLEQQRCGRRGGGGDEGRGRAGAVRAAMHARLGRKAASAAAAAAAMAAALPCPLDGFHLAHARQPHRASPLPDAPAPLTRAAPSSPRRRSPPRAPPSRSR